MQTPTTPKTPSTTEAGSSVHRRAPIDTPTAILWACAFLLTALIVTRFGAISPNSVYAEMTADAAAGLSLLTTSDGSSDEFVAILDSPTQQLYVYNVTMRDGFELVGRIELAEAFETGRKAGQ
ncbi:MAG: hypothetical protein KAS72_04650 [Phycisphaerales bacterium]|nr:hypothetical protein [Phycisphaerales bacterium]